MLIRGVHILVRLEAQKEDADIFTARWLLLVSGIGRKASIHSGEDCSGLGLYYLVHVDIPFEPEYHEQIVYDLPRCQHNYRGDCVCLFDGKQQQHELHEGSNHHPRGYCEITA